LSVKQVVSKLDSQLASGLVR